MKGGQYVTGSAGASRGERSSGSDEARDGTDAAVDPGRTLSRAADPLPGREFLSRQVVTKENLDRITGLIEINCVRCTPYPACVNIG